MNAQPYRDRRRHLALRLQSAGGGIAILPTAPERPRNGDSDHPFRHDSHFHHLSGFDEPESWLVLRSDGHSTLFCRSVNPERAIWEGPRLGPEQAPAVLGVDEAHPVERLNDLLPALIAQAPAVWSVFAAAGHAGAPLARWIAEARASGGTPTGVPHLDLGPLLDEMRLIKDSHELATMRRAAAISAGAHARAMRFCGRHFRQHPQGGLHEYEIEAELLHEFRRHGAQSPAYPSIVAAGANACVLHYAAGSTLLHPGELCLIDAGCEYDGYASDISRTFPAHGRFSAPQRELYEIVLAAQEAAIAVTRPGARQRDAHHAAVRVLSQGMLDTGLLRRDVVGSVDDVLEQGAYQRFYMHGTGHWLGRDVHDVGEYLALDEPPSEMHDEQGHTVVKPPSRALQPGMVVTLEPGLYVRPASDIPDRYWNLGIRIEDDAVITPAGCELISRGVPVSIAEIEALMRD